MVSRRSRPVAVLCVLLGGSAVLAGACGGDDAGPPETGTSLPVADDTPLGVPRPDADLPELALVPVVEMDWPTALASRPGDDDAVYVTEQEGRIWRIDLTGTTATLDEPPLLDIADQVSINTAGGEPGMLGLEFSPDGATLYLNLTEYLGEDDGWDRLLVSYELDDGPPVSVIEDTRRVLVEYPKRTPHHQGGDLRWGPDGALYSSFGDDNRRGEAQDPENLLGTIARFADPGGEHPDDHEVWLWGTRNPWRFEFDPVTGDLWIADVGSDIEEEVNWLPARETGATPGGGANLGWPMVEGSEEKDGGELPENYVAPVHTYPTRGGDDCAVVGGRVYRGSAIPSLSGGYLFSDFCGRDLRVIWAHGPADDVTVEVVDLDLEAPGGVTGFGTGPNREIYVLTAEGVAQLAPAAS
jgi:hypothetical protein